MLRENREQRNYESRKYKRHTKRNRIIETEKYNYQSHTEARPGLRCHLRIGPDMEPARSRPSIFSSPHRLCHFSSPDRGRRFFHPSTERQRFVNSEPSADSQLYLPLKNRVREPSLMFAVSSLFTRIPQI